MLSGKGDRCLIEIEAFGVNAALAHIGMAAFAGRGFKITIEELPKNLTKLDNETSKRSEKRITKMDRHRA